MAQEASPSDVDLQTDDTFDEFLDLIQEKTKEEVDDFLIRKPGTAESNDSQGDFSNQLVDALEENNVVRVWKLIANGNENCKTLESLNEVCRTIAEKENKKENGFNFLCSWDCKELCKRLKDGVCRGICWVFECDEDDIKQETEMRSETERKWIKILSNPLYMSLEWLWRNNPNSHCEGGVRLKESKSADVIEAALDDAYLLEKIASYEHHYSREEYRQRAMEYEKFAADIVEQVNPSDLKELHEIMDIHGNGCLLKKKSRNFNQSLSLLKMAADKKRKQVSIRFSGMFVSGFILHI